MGQIIRPGLSVSGSSSHRPRSFFVISIGLLLTKWGSLAFLGRFRRPDDLLASSIKLCLAVFAISAAARWIVGQT